MNNWSPESIIKSIRIQAEEAERRCKEQMDGFRAGKPTSPSSKTKDYDERWAAVFVLRDLEASANLQSREQCLAYLRDMITRSVTPFGAFEGKRFEKARVAYIRELISDYEAPTSDTERRL